MPKFHKIQIPEKDIETLRIILCSGNPEPISFYPTQLTQLSTIGIVHDYAPKPLIKEIQHFENNLTMHIPIFRFYLDGLIAHIHRQISDDGLTEKIRELVVGGGKELTITTQPFESSLQESTIKTILTKSLSW